MKRHFDRSYLASITTSLLLTVAVQGCSSNNGGTGIAANSGSAAMTPGAAGAAAAGKSGGTAGAAPVGTAGMMAAGAAAGGSGAAAGGSLTSCGPASTLPPAMLHQAAVDAIVPKDAMNVSPCAFSSCHNTTQKKAMLNLDVGTMDLKAILVDKPSCEVPALMLVKSGGGDAALTNSWLWQKLTAPDGPSGELTAQPAWGMGGASCGQDSGQPFGVRMPKGTVDMTISASKLDPIKAWICAGAPGPM